ncbi:MAG: hypothetical protein R6X33_07155 [Candidatus Brocadiia bacterium]
MPGALHQKSFVLTVAESKRLIARAVRKHPRVNRALNDGIVAVAKGSTNAYIVEEMLGEGINKAHYCTGVTKPPVGAEEAKTANKLPDVVLRHGERMEGVSATEVVTEMGPGDVFIKGANAINYDKGQAGILIGHPTGGTIGAAIGSVVARRATLLMPVGLEKNIPGDLHELYRDLTSVAGDGDGPTLWPVDGEIFTEIEALRLDMGGGRAALIGAGGIAGAEGSVRISVWGSPEHVSRAEGAVGSVRGEPPFFS